MKVILLRGISGSGKSTYTTSLVKGMKKVEYRICSVDNYFMNNGEYTFNPRLLDKAHRDCFCDFRIALERRVDLVIVDNTNTRLYELSPYVMTAKVNMRKNDTLEIIRLNCSVALAFDRNIHGVSYGSVDNMKKRMEALPSYWLTEKIIQTN